MTDSDGGLRSLLRSALPWHVRHAFNRLIRRRTPPAATQAASWEIHGAALSAEDAVGGGDFDLIGRIELGILQAEGLKPGHRVVDFGCGTGRLAVHLLPYLDGGRYFGIDIAASILEKARACVARRVPRPMCSVEWIRNTATSFPLADASVDFVCAFSVFTHVEHEDSYLYLKDALRIVAPGGRFIFSCLPMELRYAQDIFLASARRDFAGRWSVVRDVTTSVDLMNAIARLAGWRVVRWYRGDEANAPLAGAGERMVLGQSTCVLEAPLAAPGDPAK
jgi:SAM-dependent methyltransferase